MKNFFTFKCETKKGEKRNYSVTMSVKNEFRNICPDYENKTLVDLIEKCHIFKYFHNTEDYAVIDNSQGIKPLYNYFVNGFHYNTKEKFEKKVKELEIL